MSSNISRIVVFTGNLGYSIRKGIDEIARTIPDSIWLVVIHCPRKSSRQLVRNQWGNLKKNGWRWITYQIGDIYQRIAARMAKSRPNRWSGRTFTEAALQRRDNIEIRKVSDIHSDETLSAVTLFRPALGLSLAAPILRRPLFSIPSLGTINLHKGKVPEYRGMPPAFWELWNDESSVGCTVHWVDDKLDAGDVVLATRLPRERYSTVRGMQLRLDEIGVELMRDAVQQILSGVQSSTKQGIAGSTHRKPSLTQIKTLDAKLLRNQTPATSFAKRYAKRIVSVTSSGLWKLGLSTMIKPRVTVLLYHRVSDEARDNLTTGIEQFDRQMILLREHCEVLSVEEALTFTRIPKAKRPLVCVTFDDGYLDNFTNAAQILLRHEIPAAFFVSTGLIGTNRVFPHDVRRGNQPIPMMNWDHIRAMHSNGFTIGSHTVTHIDCASEPEDVVMHELMQSREDLLRELKIENLLFGYPYGGRQHMTRQRLELVKQAGFVGCLSAYGGTNIGTVDPFDVRRRGIHWEYSDDSFLFECLGLR